MERNSKAGALPAPPGAAAGCVLLTLGLWPWVRPLTLRNSLWSAHSIQTQLPWALAWSLGPSAAIKETYPTVSIGFPTTAGLWSLAATDFHMGSCLILTANLGVGHGRDSLFLWH